MNIKIKQVFHLKRLHTQLRALLSQQFKRIVPFFLLFVFA